MAKNFRQGKRLLFGALALAGACFYQAARGVYQGSEATRQAEQFAAVTDALAERNRALLRAHEKRLRGVFVEGEGVVVKVLSDDTQGDRHQRFLLAVGQGVRVLVAHNIDLAPRVEAIAVGDLVAYGGDYLYTEKGGTLHWTHHDPRGHHRDGWLQVNGKRYQ